MTTNKVLLNSTPASQPSRRRLPGMLRILPETLPFYPYCKTSSLHPSRKQKIYHDDEEVRTPPLHADENALSYNQCNIGEGKVIPNMPLHSNTTTATTTSTIATNGNCKKASFTLFFFVDSTNRHSLSAIPAVSSWFQHTLHRSANDDCTGGDDDNNNNNNNNNISENRVICIPNHPLPFEINVHNSSSDDPIIHSTIHSSTEAKPSEINSMLHPMLTSTGFYHLPFLHPARLPLLRLLNATRVPSIIVVNNCSGRVVTQYGWEAVEREYFGKLKQWDDDINGWVRSRNLASKNMNDDDDNGKGESKGENEERCFPSSCHYFESQVVEDWQRGNSGLPFHWHLLSWIL